MSEDTFEKMINFFEQTPEAGLAGCKILNPDGTLQLACRRSFPGPWTSFCKVTGLSSIFPNSKLFARYNLTFLDENETYEVDAISGSFMMFSREVYEKVGGLDEEFFMYGEDLDLCYRIQNSGYKVFYVHSTQIIHYKGESTRRSSLDETKVFYNAMHLFVKKHLASSFLVEFILRSAIIIRKFFAFWGKRKLILLSVFLDFIFFNVSLLAAEFIYKKMSYWGGFPPFSIPFIFILPALLHIITASFVGVYRKDSLSVFSNFGAIIIGFFILSALTFFFKQYAYSRAVIIITYILLFFLLTFWRIILKLFFRIGIKETDLAGNRTIVVGTNDPALKIANKLKSKESDYHSIVGLIGFSNKEIGQIKDTFEVIGNMENINKVIKERKINEVIFSSEEMSYDQMMSIVSACQNENVEFKLIGNSLDFLVGKTSVSILDDMPVFEIRYNISSPLMKFLKTTFDYIVALFVLFFIYPFIYLTVKLNKEPGEFAKFILKVPKILSGKYSFVGPKYSSEIRQIIFRQTGFNRVMEFRKNIYCRYYKN